MGKFEDLALQRVREANRAYWVNKDRSLFEDWSVCVDVPKIGLKDPSWEFDYTITNEYYNAFEQSDKLVLVSGRVSLKKVSVKNNAREFIANITVLCEKTSDTNLVFKSIHLSREDGKEILENKGVVAIDYQMRAINLLFDVVMEYQLNNNVFIYDKYRYKKLFECDTHFINMDQWFWHMCTESVHPEDTEELDIFRDIDIEKRIRHNDNVITKHVRIRNKRFIYKWIRLTIIFIPNDRNTNLERTLILIRDVHNEMSEYLENEQLARVDGLTNAWNRPYTEQLINNYLSSHKSGVFIILDVDKFKSINDNFGHITGDDVLKKISSTINSVITCNDIFGRIGGDEFVLFLSEPIHEKEIMNKISYIMKSICFEYSECNINMDVHCSAGVAIVNQTEKQTNFEELYRQADIALYDAKRSGRNTYKVYYK